jgi:DNA (cytosine-5)-methyltransferase 1
LPTISIKKRVRVTPLISALSICVCDIASLTTADIPAGRVDLAWCSFPCTDLSIAGDREGLKGARSSTFWPFMRLVEGLRAEGRAPRLIVIENVTGLLSTHGGQGFEAIRCALFDVGYRVGAVIIDAAHFVPQSRARLFIVAADADVHIPGALLADKPTAFHPLPFVPPPLVNLCDPLDDSRRDAGHPSRAPLWWRLPVPPQRNTTLADVLEDDALVRWHTPAQTARLMAMMTEGNRAKVENAKRAGKRMVGGLFKRMRDEADGVRRQRAEVRFDGVAGCLRVPRGGSSRQTIVIVEGDRVRSRLLSPRECARLMGLSDEYGLPENANEGLHLIGDGVAVPVVRFLAESLLEPILGAAHIDGSDADTDAHTLWFELHEDDAREWSCEPAEAR